MKRKYYFFIIIFIISAIPAALFLNLETRVALQNLFFKDYKKFAIGNGYLAFSKDWDIRYATKKSGDWGYMFGLLPWRPEKSPKHGFLMLSGKNNLKITVTGNNQKVESSVCLNHQHCRLIKNIIFKNYALIEIYSLPKYYLSTDLNISLIIENGTIEDLERFDPSFRVTTQ